jgi:hypothetical protein
MPKDNFDEAYKEFLKGVQGFWRKLDVEALDVRELPPLMLPLITMCTCGEPAPPRRATRRAKPRRKGR